MLPLPESLPLEPPPREGQRQVPQPLEEAPQPAELRLADLPAMPGVLRLAQF